MAHRIALLTTLAACSFAALLPAAAGAATHVDLGESSYSGHPLTSAVSYQPDAGETVHIELSQTATDFVVTAPNAVDLWVTPPCVAASPTVVRCPLAQVKAFMLNFAGVPTAPVFVSAAPDVTADVIARGTGPFADTLQGGAGNDELDGAWPGEDGGVRAADTVNGGAGNDHLVVGGPGTADGGPGDDVIQAADGRTKAATMLGGDGNDHLMDAVVADGGAGDDEIDRALQVDGGAGNDKIFGTQHGTGGPGDDFISGDGPGAVIDGGDGNDNVASTGPETIAHGGPGNDYMEEELGGYDGGTLLAGDDGDDTFDGWGRGATLDGGPGNDTMGTGTLVVAPSRAGNTYLGGPGADLIYAHDGIVDRIDCGADADTVHRDATDTVTGCENDPDAPVPMPLPVRPKVQTAIIPLAFRGTTRFTVTTKGTVHVAVRCPKGVTCAGRLRLTTGKVVLGAVTCAIKGDKTVTLKLNRAALKLLRKRRHHTLTATLSLTPGKLTAAPKPRRITLRLPTRH